MAASPLLSFLPAVIRRRLVEGVAPHAGVEHHDAVVLAADVSGFTQLVASARDTPAGIDEVSGILNDGFGRLIDAIDEAGGDTLGFAGDSLLAFWPTGPDALLASASAGLDAQRRLQSADPRIRVRIGLAVGELDLWTVGGVGDRWLVVPGGVGAAAAAALQVSAELGQVVVTEAFADAAPASIRTRVEDGVHRLVEVDAEALVRIARSASPHTFDTPDTFDTAAALDPARLAPFLPETIVARLQAGHDQYLSELRTITAVFVRVAGLGHETGLETMQAAVRGIQDSTSRYEGTLTAGADEKGITFVAAFGMPPGAHEDDADRALSAAAAVHRSLSDLELVHGIGVATGRAFCGPKGNDTRREYTALSDAVNVAARLAAAASASGRPAILSEPMTIAAARGQWSFATAVSLRVKGKSELMTAFGLQHRIARAALATSRMVGRGDELTSIVERLVAPAGETGRLVVIVGEPGIGKTSLLAAIADTLRTAGHRVVEGYADSLERSVPFRAWSTVFATILGIELDDRERTREELHAHVGARAPLLAPVLGMEIEETAETAALGSEARLAATRGLLVELLAGAAAPNGRLHVLLEDAHWFDSASRGLLEEALRSPGLAVTLTSRPGDDTGRGSSIAPIEGVEQTEIRLLPFSPAQVEELVRVHLGADDVDPAAGRLLADTCKGNPFFTVEVMKGLSQRGALVVRDGTAVLAGDRRVEVPVSIQAALMARIDALSQDQQLTLKVASVVGSPFETSILARIHPTGRSLDGIQADLRGLEERGLVVPAEVGTYAFNHVLTQEVAYGLMMGDQRRDLHRSVAICYEESEDGAEVHSTLLPVLAHHWLHAENAEQAISYLTRAAVSSLAHGMPREAVDHGVRAARVLGIELETDPAKIRAMLPGELAEIERLMAGRRPADLAALPELIDEAIGAGIGIVLQSMPSAHQSLQTELFALMAIRNLNLTLRFGAGILAPGVYAMYSVVLRGLNADSATAYAFSQLARDVDAMNGGILPAVVAFVHVWFNNHWLQPLASGIPIARAGADAGLAGPDLLYGSFNLAAATTALAVSGAPLDEVIATGEADLARIGTQSATAAFHCRLEAQMAKALAGRTPALASLTDEAFDEAELAAMATTSNFNQTAYYFIAKLRLAYLAGDVHGARAWAGQAEQLLPSFAGQPGQGELATLAALARLATLPDDPAGRAAELDDARGRLAQLDAWAALCPANFDAKAALVRGELAVVEGDEAGAATAFKAAIDSATTHGFRQWAALAAERHGHALVATNPARAREQFAVAAEHYRAWGATRKADELAALSQRDATVA